MNVYFVNKTPLPDGRHEIHRANCTYLPLPGHRIYLGVFSTCQQAISEAKKYYYQLTGCHVCSVVCVSKQHSCSIVGDDL